MNSIQERVAILHELLIQRVLLLRPIRPQYPFHGVDCTIQSTANDEPIQLFVQKFYAHPKSLRHARHAHRSITLQVLRVRSDSTLATKIATMRLQPRRQIDRVSNQRKRLGKLHVLAPFFCNEFKKSQTCQIFFIRSTTSPLITVDDIPIIT